MRHIVTTSLIAIGIAAGAAASPASPFRLATDPASLQTADGGATLWLAKQDKAKGNGKGKGQKEAKAKKQKPGKSHEAGKKHDKDKPQKAAAKKDDKPQEAKAPGKDRLVPGQVKKQDGKTVEKAAGRLTGKDRKRHAEEVLKVKAPKDRDMAVLLGAAGLALAGPNLVVAEVPETELITYRNCPPGLAKKDPPCVPPGLAKKGVTNEEWLTYDNNDYDRLWLRERDAFLRGNTIPEDGSLLLDSAQIASLYGLGGAPSGQRYALIDGLPVLLDTKDYNSLLLINQLAGLTDLPSGVEVAPTAALTQEELLRLYRLPQPQTGYNYSVLNGQLISLDDDAYQMLQMIRIARAVL
jgi:hypothetical protein